MYIVLTEDQNDYSAIKEILKKLENNPNLSVKGKGFNGSGDLFNLGAATINSLISLNNPPNPKCVVVHDCDKDPPAKRHERVKVEIFKKIKSKSIFCSVIPKEEIEAWILADLQCVTRVYPGWRPTQTYPSPESVDDPKKELIRLSRLQNLKPRYSESDCKLIASELDLNVVLKKCPSFKDLYDLVKLGKGNHP